MSNTGEFVYGHRAAVSWLEENGYVMSVGRLMNIKSQGIGPPVEKMGTTVAYRIEDLSAWAQKHWGKRSGNQNKGLAKG
jgi:hypothetical protein